MPAKISQCFPDFHKICKLKLCSRFCHPLELLSAGKSTWYSPRVLIELRHQNKARPISTMSIYVCKYTHKYVMYIRVWYVYSRKNWIRTLCTARLKICRIQLTTRTLASDVSLSKSSGKPIISKSMTTTIKFRNDVTARLKVSAIYWNTKTDTWTMMPERFPYSTDLTNA